MLALNEAEGVIQFFCSIEEEGQATVHCIGAQFQFEAFSGNADEPKLFWLAISLANKSDDAFPISLASFANRNLRFLLQGDQVQLLFFIHF